MSSYEFNTLKRDGPVVNARKRLGFIVTTFVALYIPTVITWTFLRIFLIAFEHRQIMRVGDRLVYFPYWVCEWLDHLPFHHLGSRSVGEVIGCGFAMVVIFVVLPCLLLQCEVDPVGWTGGTGD